jgi:threonine dehydrogenase-like Zn-dependent dehydrogenase
MAKTMRACVLNGARNLHVAEIPTPEPGPHDVLVRVAAVGLCGTDFHIFIGEANYNTDERGRIIPLAQHPQTLGHEISGVVETIGSEVTDLQPGDRVILDQGLNCLSLRRTSLCEYCSTGDSHQCEFYREHGITGLPGGLAEFISVPATNAIRIDSELEFAQAAMSEPLACIVHSMNTALHANARYRLFGEDSQRRVRNILILGAGPAGLLFLQYLRNVLGFDGTILVSEPNPKKRALAAHFGASVIDPASKDVTEEVRNHTSGCMADFVIESSGAGAVFPTIPTLIRKQATVLLYGHGHGGVDMSALNNLQFKEPVLVSPVGASGGFAADGRPLVYREALRLIEHGTVQVAPIISHRYGKLEDVGRAFSEEFVDAGYTKGIVQLL